VARRVASIAASLERTSRTPNAVASPSLGDSVAPIDGDVTSLRRVAVRTLTRLYQNEVRLFCEDRASGVNDINCCVG
jgi:hypothetical protein